MFLNFACWLIFISTFCDTRTTTLLGILTELSPFLDVENYTANVMLQFFLSRTIEAFSFKLCMLTRLHYHILRHKNHSSTWHFDWIIPFVRLRKLYRKCHASIFFKSHWNYQYETLYTYSSILAHYLTYHISTWHFDWIIAVDGLTRADQKERGKPQYLKNY